MVAMPHRIADNNRVRQLRLLGLTEEGFSKESFEHEFDTLAQLAVLTTAAPMAGVSLVDENDVWLVGRSGIDDNRFPRSESFCSSVVDLDASFEVVDTFQDSDFLDLAIVKDLGVRSYCGVPLRLATGTVVGALFVLDYEARRLNQDQRQALSLLAAQAVVLLERRRKDVLWLRIQTVLGEHNGSAEPTLQASAIEAALELSCDLLGADLGVWTDRVSGLDIVAGDASLITPHRQLDQKLAEAPAMGGLDEKTLAGTDPTTNQLHYSGARIHTRRQMRGTLSFSRHRAQPLDQGIDRSYVDLLARYLSELFEGEELASARDALAQQNDDAAWLNERLLTANEDLRRFARYVVEELGLPLRAVEEQLGSLAGLLDVVGSDPKKRIDNLERSVTRMASVLNELIAFARYELGLTNDDTVDLNHALERAIEAESAAISASRLRISPAPLPTVRADPSEMEQALRIMVRNAARFAASERAELVVSATTKDGQWVVSFLDNGTPIASEAVQHLFKIEVNDTHEPAVPALALVRKMVERYGGSIEVDTEYARGAHLLLRFPVAPVPDAQ